MLVVNSTNVVGTSSSGVGSNSSISGKIHGHTVRFFNHRIHVCSLNKDKYSLVVFTIIVA